MARDLLGMSSPFRRTAGRLPTSGDLEESVRQSIHAIITTRKMERVNRPDIGCRIWDFIFEPNTDIARIRIRDEVRQAIASQEPRVRVLAVDVQPDTSISGLSGYTLSLTYQFNGEVYTDTTHLTTDG